MGDYELTAADLSEITYTVVVTVQHGRQYQATIGRHVVTLERIPTIPGAWKASLAGLGLVGGNRYELAGPRFYWSEAWAYAFPSAGEALFTAVALIAAVKDAPGDIAEDIPGANFPVAVLTIEQAELPAFAGVPTRCQPRTTRPDRRGRRRSG